MWTPVREVHQSLRLASSNAFPRDLRKDKSSGAVRLLLAKALSRFLCKLQAAGPGDGSARIRKYDQVTIVVRFFLLETLEAISTLFFQSQKLSLPGTVRACCRYFLRVVATNWNSYSIVLRIYCGTIP